MLRCQFQPHLAQTLAFVIRFAASVHLPADESRNLEIPRITDLERHCLVALLLRYLRGGLLQGLAGVPVSQYLKILLPLTAVFMLAIFLEYRADMGADRARLLSQETSVVQRGVRRVEREMEIATGDLYFVADLVAEVVDDEAPDRLAALERGLLAFVRRRPGYIQIRFIGATGQEILSVENAPSGPRITPESERQH